MAERSANGGRSASPRRQKAPGLTLYNTLSRAKERFTPLEPGRVRMYTCGPTVYRYAHIGNLRSYLAADWLRRLLKASGHNVTHVKNITDVGHMRQEMLERGEDKVVAAALAEGKTPAEIAGFYTEAFMEDERRLNVLPAHIFPRATEAVDDMVEMTRTLVDKGFAYESGANVYFAVDHFPEYGKLSGQVSAALEVGVRVEADPLKRDQRDFALWKAAEPGRHLAWPSPWGDGFPGWHIECSAMVARHLGPRIDIHTGGVDNIFPHHEDEIAQSEAALGRKHVNYWLHGQHLMVDGLKMAKSSGNAYTLSDLSSRGFEPLAFRYLCATIHYRTRMNFSFASLRAAQRALCRLRLSLTEPDGRMTKAARREGERMRRRFWDAAGDDLGLPRALAVAWRVARSRLSAPVKRELLMDFDRLLGLDLVQRDRAPRPSEEVRELVRERGRLRRARDYKDADQMREKITAQGLEIRDTAAGTVVLPAPEWARGQKTISASGDVESLLEGPPDLDFTVGIVARQGCQELERCLGSIQRRLGSHRAEVIVVDNGIDEDCGHHLDAAATSDPHLRVFHADHFLGSAAGRNVCLRRARGRYVLLMDTSVEATGDIFPRLRTLLDDPTVGVVGRWGVMTDDIRTFEEAQAPGDVDAVEGYLMAFRREILRETGLLDEKFRFYRHMDLDFSFAVRSRGYRALVDAKLPLRRHEHVDWERTPPQDRERLSKRNFYRFLHKWGDRGDLVLSGRP
ncbi:MAG: cysteine--tRNA ligase [Chloroflexi bacterium RBG_16_64_32]|nr:MAG: cysteine--tRNA ligase [Chloroflexi bacterium RBG_16_64_32]